MKIKPIPSAEDLASDSITPGFTMEGHATVYRPPQIDEEIADKLYTDSMKTTYDTSQVVGSVLPKGVVVNSFSGDISAFNGTDTLLKGIGVVAGNYNRFTVNAKGQITSATSVPDTYTVDEIYFAGISERPTKVSGYVQETTQYTAYTSDGSSNITVNGNLKSANPPVDNSHPVNNSYLNTQLSQLPIVKGSVGELKISNELSNKDGWLRANGALVDKTTYSALYAIIGDIYGAGQSGGSIGYMGQPWRQQYMFNATNQGDITGWTTGTGLLVRYFFTQAVVTKNRVYLLGGYNGSSYSSACYTAPINADGTLGTWTTSTSLPGTLVHSQAIVTKNRVYLMGGYNGGKYLTTVYTAPINADGTLGTWSTATSLPTAVGLSQAVVTKNRVYLLGGYNGGNYQSTTYSAPINSDGTLSSWSAGPSLPKEVGESHAVLTKGRVYLLGGHNNSGDLSTTYTATINADGTLSAWVESNPLPTVVNTRQVIVTKNWVYLVGGHSSLGDSSAVHRAPIDTNGVIGEWVVDTALPATVTNSQLIVTSSRVYLLGGLINGFWSSTVYTAPFPGVTNDYVTLISDSETLSSQFRLPDLSSESNGLMHYYIRALP